VFNIIRFLLTYTLNLFFSPLTYLYRNNGCVFSLSYHNLCCKYLAKRHLGVWIRSGEMDRSNKRLQLLKQQLLNSVTNSTHSCLSFEWYKRWLRENEDTQLALWVTLIIACLLSYFFLSLSSHILCYFTGLRFIIFDSTYPFKKCGCTC